MILPDFSEEGSFCFQSSEQFTERLEKDIPLAVVNDVREYIGESKEGRPIVGFRIGSGVLSISLLAGSHADEPVGPETLRRLVLRMLLEHELFSAALTRFTFYIVPHVNPDGEHRNRKWIDSWPNLRSYLSDVVREPPGEDVEFSYPDRRPENRAVMKFLSPGAPFRLHMSLHGMGFSDGAMLLIEKNWTYRTDEIQSRFTAAAAALGLEMHDHNRMGEKGFFYIAPGFTTTPEGAAMRIFFRAQDKPGMAELFGDSSMEAIRALGGDPLCLVTELPLFVVDGPREPGRPVSYLAFREARREIRAGKPGKEDLMALNERFGLKPLSLSRAMSLQWKTIDLGLQRIAEPR
jgi:Zinc carboxypeptidase